MEPMGPEPIPEPITELIQALKTISYEVNKVELSHGIHDNTYNERLEEVISGLNALPRDEDFKERLRQVGLTGELLTEKLYVMSDLFRKGKLFAGSFLLSTIFQSLKTAADRLLDSKIMIAIDFINEFIATVAGKAELETTSDVPPKKKVEINPFTGKPNE